MFWLLVVVLLALQLATAPLAGAAAGHLFDAELSLRGDCSVSTLDEVPDPGPCPGVAGVDHPPKAFEQPCGTAVDRAGFIYVASSAQAGSGTQGRIDVFNSQGKYLTQIEDERQPCGVAVDSAGNVYVAEYEGKNTVLFEPETYPPSKGSKYVEPGTVVHEPDHSNGSNEICTGSWSVAIDPSNDHLYIGMRCSIIEYSSAAEGSTVVQEGIGAGASGLDQAAVYGANHDVYSTVAGPANEGRVAIFDGGDGQEKCEIDGSETPEGGFAFPAGAAGIAVDQANGDVYVADVGELGHEAVDQFTSGCTYIGQVKHSFKEMSIFLSGAGLAVDSPCRNTLEESCDLAPYASPNEGNLYVIQGNNKASYHLYAFEPAVPPVPPSVVDQTAGDITDTEALLQGKVNPGNTSAEYHFEYVTQAAFDQVGYAGAASVPVPQGQIETGSGLVSVAAAVAGLQPDMAYRFRLVASNHCNLGEPQELCVASGEGGEGRDAAFSTFPSSSGLPDGRGYELVTPADTNGRIPTLSELGSGFNTSTFNSSPVTADGRGLIFGTEGGAIPELGGGGYHDVYEARRDPQAGWRSSFVGPSAAQAQEPHPGGVAADHSLAFWQVEGAKGALAVDGQTGANYLRRPGGLLTAECSPEPAGLFEFVGCGSLGVEPFAAGVWISPGGGHVVFTTDAAKTGVPAKRLEPCAPPSGTSAVYDRTADGVTHCVSLLPGNVTPTQRSEYQGVSRDGSAVAFTVESDPSLYVRLGDSETVEASAEPVRFAGLSDDGGWLFYLRPNPTQPLLPGSEIPQGEIFACEVRLGPCAGPGKTQDPIAVGAGDQSVVVNVSSDGSCVYFVSPAQLDGSKGDLGADNLYEAVGGEVHFVAELVHSDLVGHAGIPGGADVGGLGLWITAAMDPEPGSQSGAASDPSRSSPDGSVLVFESRADLAGHENAGHTEIYRFDSHASPATALSCVSCDPAGMAAVSDAQLQSDYGAPFATFPPVTAMTPVANLAAGGRRVYFQSADRLALGDTDGMVDVYQWEAAGTGGCQKPAGCLDLISGGRSASNDYLYAVSPSGDDVFFESGDRLVDGDTGGTPSIYDARQGGGFPPAQPPARECSGEGCAAPGVVPAPAAAGSASFIGPGNRRHSCLRKKSRRRPRTERARKRCTGKRRPARHRSSHRHRRLRRAGG